jgi:SagB-type dehydrogenase family enzyme
VSRRYRRSPYLASVWRDDELELLHGDTLRRYKIHANMLALLSACGEWTTAETLAASGYSASGEDLAALHELGLLEAEDDAAGHRSAKFTWDPLELAVHRRTAFGGYWPERVDSSCPPELSKPLPQGPHTRLPEPASLGPQSFGDVLEHRRSVRTYAERSLQLEELSTLLHHAARVVKRVGDVAFRPFAAAGARSELEIYVVSTDVARLDQGVHYYDPHSHGLVKIRERDGHQARLLDSVRAAAGGVLNRDPPVILLITAVFERVMWKYRNLGLSLIYKDTGCLFQTLYLVAAAMGLAPCAIGAGDEAENSRWLGLDPLSESQVGCFLIGPGARGSAA